MKSLFKILGLASVSLIAAAHADANTQSTSQTQMQMITPSAGPRVENAMDGVITADFIYLDATQTGLDYARNFITAASAGTTVENAGKIYYPHYKFDPGFRIGLGLDLAHDAWDIMANYTWFHTGTHTTRDTFPEVDGNSTIGASAGYLTPEATTPVYSGGSDWRLKLDTIDVDLGRNYFISQYLALRPFFGAKAAWNRQQFDSYVDTSTSSTTGLMYNYQQQTAFEIGIRTGFNTSWQFTRNWNIYGNAAFNLLSAHQKTHYKVTFQANETDTNVIQNINFDQYTIQPVIELGMGFGYECFFFDDSYHFAVSAGWEFQYWNNNNRFGNNILENASTAYTNFLRFGDLSIQGFDLKFRLDF